MHTVTKRAIAFFRTANNAAASDAERTAASAKLAEYCAKHNVDLAAIVAAVEADSVTPMQRVRDAMQRTQQAASKPDIDATKRAHADTASKPGNGAKPERKAAPKPEKPAKPADESKAAAYAERVELVGKLRDLVTGLYNGPSLAVRSNPKRIAAAVYASLLAAPKHRTTLDRISVRDESALFLILKHGERNGSFDPVHLNLDSGIFSRLASVGFIIGDGPGAFLLSADALKHARSAAKRAA